jgi:hypothetical protein
MLKRNLIPEGVRVLADGSWRLGEQPLSHPRRLRYLKQHLTFADDGVFLADGAKRVNITVDGPPFVVDSVVFDTESGQIRVRLDDGSEEALTEPIIRMNAETGQFVCAVKGGRTHAVLSRVAHDALLDALEQEGGEFYVPLGTRRGRVLP